MTSPITITKLFGQLDTVVKGKLIITHLVKNVNSHSLLI